MIATTTEDFFDTAVRRRGKEVSSGRKGGWVECDARIEDLKTGRKMRKDQRSVLKVPKVLQLLYGDGKNE